MYLRETRRAPSVFQKNLGIATERPSSSTPQRCNSGQHKQQSVAYKADPILRFQFNEPVRRCVDNVLRYRRNNHDKQAYRQELGEGQGLELGEGLGPELDQGQGLELGEGQGLELGEGLGPELGEGQGLELGEGQRLELDQGQGLELGEGQGLELD
jgi:hypothetical protein